MSGVIFPRFACEIKPNTSDKAINALHAFVHLSDLRDGSNTDCTKYASTGAIDSKSLA